MAIWYPKLSFSEELLAWWQGQAHKLISQKNCNNVRILICAKKKFAKKNCSALLAIHSPTFMNEIRTDMPIPGAPLPPTAIANKKRWCFLAWEMFNWFPFVKSLFINNQVKLPALKWIQQAPYIQEEYFCDHCKDHKDFAVSISIVYIYYLS